MKKKIALTVASLFLMSSAAFAAPMTDYYPGKVSVDLSFRNTKNSYGGDGFKSRYNFEPSFTFGLTNNLALQYRSVNAKSGGSPSLKLNVTEFNVLYGLTPQVSAFGGFIKTKGTLAGSSDDRNTMQLGLLSTIPVARKVSLYGIIGAGDKWTNSEVGVSYIFADNWEFNLDYRYMNAKKLLYKNDVKAKGLGFGVTYKFY